VKLTGCSWLQESLEPFGVLRLSHGRSGSEFCWHSSHSLMTFRPFPARASRVFPSHPLSAAEALDRRPSWPSSLLQSARESAETSSRWPLLSWDSSVALPLVYLPRVHSQEPRLPSDRRCQAPIHVPPSWFRTTSMVFSARELRVCCTPQPAKGSSRFMRAASPLHPKVAQFAGCISPRRGSHPSKTSPRQQPYRITAAVAFLPLPSCPARVPTEVGFLADRRTPKRVTYTCDSLPWLAGPACPEGRLVRCRRGIAPNGAESPLLRRARVALRRCDLARGTPKSATCLVP
jgi:hypothetical protein